jgi:hypothetical protein
MEWGLDGVQLSHLNKSVNFNDIKLANTDVQKILDQLKDVGVDLMSMIQSLVNSTIQDKGLPFYDFYIPADKPGTGVTTFNYDGLSMNRNIIQFVRQNNTGFELLDLDSVPSSAIQYCYNKNKRDPATGKVTTLHWYVPAIDEIEDITISSYEDFDVFRNKFYWSCQPAYYMNKVEIPENSYEIIYTGWPKVSAYISKATGSYNIDNTQNARATKIFEESEQFKNVNSGVGQENYYQFMSLSGQAKIKAKFGWPPVALDGNPSIKYTITLDPNFDLSKYDPGNLPRTGVKNRVRCVYSKEGIAL